MLLNECGWEEMRQEPDHRRTGKQAKLFGLHPTGKGEPWVALEDDRKHDQSGTLERKVTLLSFLLIVLCVKLSSMYRGNTQVVFIVWVNGCMNKQRHNDHRNGWMGGGPVSSTGSESVIVKFEISVILFTSYVTLGRYLTFFFPFLLVFFFFFKFGY